MAQGVVARCYDLQDAAGPGCGKSYRLSGLSELSGVGLHFEWLNFPYPPVNALACSENVMAIDDKGISNSVEDAPNTERPSTALNTTADADVLVIQEQGQTNLTETMTIRAEHSDKLRWAEIKVRTEWSEDGSTFTWTAEECRASADSNWSGRANLSCTSKNYSDYEFVAAIPQDREWRSVNRSRSVPGNADFAIVGFKFDCRVAIDGWVYIKSEAQVKYKPVPLVITSKNETYESEFDIHGTRAARGALLFIYKGPNDVISNGTNNGDGTWRARVQIPRGSDRITLTAKQSVNGKISDISNSVTVVLKVNPVVIDIPQPNDIITTPTPTVSGKGHDGAEIKIYESGNSALVYGSGVVRNGTWAIPLVKSLPIGGFIFHASQTYHELVKWSNTVLVTVIPATPIILRPDPNSTQPESFVLSGSEGVLGSTMQVFIDQTQDKVGESTVTGSLWEVRVTVPAGRRSLVAQQTINGHSSGRSIARVFNISPAAVSDLTVSVERATVTISGKGTIAARLDCHMSGEPEPFASFPLTAVQWSKDFGNWLPGSDITISVRQSISDNFGGRIYSAWTSKTFDVPVPPPTLEAEVGPNDIPRFFGTGEYWSGQPASQVEVWLSGGTEPIVPPAAVNSSGDWSITALQPWLPGIYQVCARLGFSGGFSAWTAQKQVIVRLPAPTIDPIDERSLSPRFTGTCVSGAPVTLTFSGDPTPYAATVSGLTWHFQRPQPFVEGVSYTLEAVQTVGGQPSAPAIKPFTVYQERLKPTINQPVHREEVDSALTVVGGNGMAGASMQLWDARDKKPLGDPVELEADGNWAIKLEELAIDQWFITAQQTLRGRPSEHSDIREFAVVVLPPTFLVPQPNDNLPRTSTLSGKGRPGGRVTVWCKSVEEPVLRNVLISPNGDWEGEVTLDVGNRAFWATQTFQEQTSKPSPEVLCSFVPQAVFPESPTAEEHLGAKVTVAGFAVPGDLITVSRGDTVLGQAPVLPDRTWSISATLGPPEGPVTLSLVASKGDFHSAPSEWVGQLGLYLPTILKPSAGEWVTAIPTFAGEGRPGLGTLVSWFDPNAVVAGNIPVSAEGWTAISKVPLAPGAQWCRFQQVLEAGTPISDWSESQRFDVRGEQPGSN